MWVRDLKIANRSNTAKRDWAGCKIAGFHGMGFIAVGTCCKNPAGTLYYSKPHYQLQNINPLKQPTFNHPFFGSCSGVLRHMFGNFRTCLEHVSKQSRRRHSEIRRNTLMVHLILWILSVGAGFSSTVAFVHPLGDHFIEVLLCTKSLHLK